MTWQTNLKSNKTYPTTKSTQPHYVFKKPNYPICFGNLFKTCVNLIVKHCEFNCLNFLHCFVFVRVGMSSSVSILKKS